MVLYEYSAAHARPTGVERADAIDAAKGERAPDRRLTSRNGYRERRWDTRVGTIGLAIPKVRDGSYGFSQHPGV